MLMKMKIAALAAACLLTAEAARAETLYKFAVSPEGSKATFGVKWEPIIKALSEKSGLPLQLVIEDGYDAYYAKYAKRAYDFVYINPLSFVRKAPAGAYVPIARKEGKLQGMIVVAKDSPLAGIRDLSGKRIAYASRDSYAATILTQEDLKAAGVDPEKGAVYTGAHDKAYAEVIAGRADAAGANMGTFKLLKPEDAGKLRILYTGTPVVSHPFVARADLPKDVVKKMQDALISLAATPEGLGQLKAAGLGALIAASEEDYAALRK